MGTQNYDLGDLARWRLLDKKGIEFAREEPRKVRLELFGSGEALVSVEQGKRSFPLGLIDGYTVVSFWVPGRYRIWAEGVCYGYTPEMETLATEIPGAVTFTRIVERRQRNPELELMMSKMTANLERRIQQVTRDASLKGAADAREAVREALEKERAERAEAERKSIERSAAAVAEAEAAATT